MDVEQTLVDFDPRLQGPFSMIIAGPSGCGKTELITALLHNCRHLITPHVHNIVYHYGAWQNAYSKMDARINFKQGLPTLEELEPKSASGNNHTLCIIDDLMSETGKQIVADLFTKGCHHWNVSVIYVTQNIYERSCKYFRTMSLNANYMVIFKNPRDMSQIQHLSRQIFPTKSRFLTNVYNQETQKPHSYILVDFKQKTPERFRVRSSITSPDNQIVFSV